MSEEPIVNVDEIRATAFEDVDINDDPARSYETSTDELNLDVILDVPVTLSMEIGRTQINIRNLL